MKLAKTIQLDVSDTHVFERPAKPQEWAISGTFAFVDSEPENWPKKQKFSFQSAWLSIETFGNATFVQVAEISEEEREFMTRALASYLIERYNAPSSSEANKAAKYEIDDMATLCVHPTGTLLTIERFFSDKGIEEKIRAVKPGNNPLTAKAWAVEKK